MTTKKDTTQKRPTAKKKKPSKAERVSKARKRGRPTVVTKEVLEIATDLSKSGLTTRMISDFLGLSNRTLENNSDFMRIYKKGVATIGNRVRTKLCDRAEEGDITALIYLDKVINKAMNGKEEADLALKKEELKIKRQQLNVDETTGKLMFNIVQAKDAEPKE